MRASLLLLLLLSLLSSSSSSSFFTVDAHRHLFPHAGVTIGCDRKPVDPSCPAGRVCCDDTIDENDDDNEDDDCPVLSNSTKAKLKAIHEHMATCGGEKCPAAVYAWHDVNMAMHVGMMDLNLTGNVNVDFVRSMIPHHQGAIDMCRVLLDELTCVTKQQGDDDDDDEGDDLDGLVEFCTHLEEEQSQEIQFLRHWLENQGLEETVPCNHDGMNGMNDMNDMHHRALRDIALQMASSSMSSSSMAMPASCGETTTPASQEFIALNHRMHVQMAVNYSCSHTVDFVRQMMPHHAAAVDMCAILLLDDASTVNDDLTNLCNQITDKQTVEIAWMYQWLTNRHYAVTAPCPSCTGMSNHDDGMATSDAMIPTGEENTDMMGDHDADDDFEPPCEDLLSMTSFCYGRFKLCDCHDLVDHFGQNCNACFTIEGYGFFDPTKLCTRTCGLCPSENSTVWVGECMMHGEHGTSTAAHDDGDDMTMTRGLVSSQASSAAWRIGTGWNWNWTGLLATLWAVTVL